MRVLVTGRQGQLARSLQERSQAFPALDFRFAGRPELDLADAGSIRRTIAEAAPQVVVNAAAYTAVDRAEEEVEAADLVNALAPAIIAECARAVGARTIQLSTDYVFDGRSPDPYREGDVTGPINVYGRTKLAGEAAVRSADPHHAIIRTSWVYSPFGRNFVKTMLALAGSRDQVRVVSDQVGTPTSALDLADAILAVLQLWLREPALGIGETYHFAGRGGCSWAAFAERIFAASAELGGPAAQVIGIASEEYPTAAARPRNSMLSSAKFERTFGFSSPPWEQSTALVVRRLLESGEA